MTAIILIVLEVITLVSVIIGVILGGLSLRDGKNVFGITGFMLNQLHSLIASYVILSRRSVITSSVASI